MDLPFYDEDGVYRSSQFFLDHISETREEERDEWGLDADPETGESWSRLDPDSLKLSQRLDEMAGRLIAWVKDLHGSRDELERLRDELGGLEDATLLRHAPGLTIPWDQEDAPRYAGLRYRARDVLEHFLDYRLCEEQVAELPSAVGRLMELLPLVLSQRPGDLAVRRFLQRVSRCYVFGFFPECVIVCRAVLENAMKDTYERKNAMVPADEQGHSSMRSLLEWAHLRGWLSAAEQNSARTVWMRGNKAVHDDPLATKDVLGTIEMTVGVLEELYAA